MNNIFKEKVAKEFNKEKNYNIILQKNERRMGMNKIGYILVPVCAVAIIAVGIIGVNLNKDIDDKNPIVSVADNIKINEIQNYASTKLMVDSKIIEKDSLPKELEKLTKVGGLDASFIQTYYTKSDNTSEEFDLLHDYVFLYFDEASDKTIKISCSNVGNPLRDYFFQVSAEDISSLGGVECKISKYEDKYIVNFEKDNYKYDVETNGLKEAEMISLMKEIIK